MIFLSLMRDGVARLKKRILKMNREIIFTIFVITTCLTLIFYGMFSGTPIDKYIPKNTEEEQIISLINTFHKARTEYDLKTYLACLDTQGRYMFSGTRMVSKEELAKFLPEFWEDLKSENMLPRPICRESLNGNFFNGRLYDPIISVENRQATAILKFVTPIIRWKTILFIDLKKQNGDWQINRFEWDMG